jgi:hypothetical protein
MDDTLERLVVEMGNQNAVFNAIASSYENLNAAVLAALEVRIDLEKELKSLPITWKRTRTKEAVALAHALQDFSGETLRDLKRGSILRKMPKRKAEDLISYCIDQGFFEISSRPPKNGGRSKQILKICRKSIKEYLSCEKRT